MKPEINIHDILHKKNLIEKNELTIWSQIHNKSFVMYLTLEDKENDI